MAGPGTGMGIAVTTVTTDAQAPLGFIHTEPASSSQGLLAQGEKSWIYVRAAAALALGEVCIRQGSVTDDAGNYGDPDSTVPVGTGVILSSGLVAVSRVVGVAQHAIAINSYGFIQRSGICTVLDDSNLAIDLGITPDSLGQATTAAVGVDSFGLVILLDGGGAGDPSTCMIDCNG